MLFNANDDGKDKELINFGFERSSRRGNFVILLSGTQCSVHCVCMCVCGGGGGGGEGKERMKSDKDIRIF